MDTPLPLYLASASPRRAQLLAQLGIPFQVVVPSITELSPTAGAPRIIARRNALRKALSVADQLERGIVIGGDTLVVTDQGKVLGKPNSSGEALSMLRLLSGRAHRVLSALALVDAATGRRSLGCSSARVWFRSLPEEALRRYVATGEPLGKAGGYAIQGRGAFLVKRVAGSYTTVVGLPLELLLNLMESFGLHPWQYWKVKET